jgi:hypothetical protein
MSYRVWFRPIDRQKRADMSALGGIERRKFGGERYYSRARDHDFTSKAEAQRFAEYHRSRGCKMRVQKRGQR